MLDTILGLHVGYRLVRRLSRDEKKNEGEPDGGGVDGHGVHLSPWIHQEYTFRHRNARRTPAESGQEYLATKNEYIEPHKTQ